MRLHYYTDCDEFAGCEQMLAVLIGTAMKSSARVDLVFSYRASTAYTTQARSRLPLGAPMHGLKLPDTGALRTALGRATRGRVLRTLKAITYILPLRQLFQIFDIARLFGVFRRSQPDLVHINNGGFPGAPSCNAAAVAARLAGVPVVVYVVNNVATGYRSPLRWADYPLDRLAARSVTRFVTGSSLAADALRDVLRLASGKVEPRHNGVALRAPEEPPSAPRSSLGIAADATIVAVIARLEPRKGHSYLISAFGSLVAQGVAGSAVLVIEGVGPSERSVRSATAAANCGDRILLTGQLPNVWNLLAAADIVALPSLDHEDFPNVVLEAMAMAKPVVASSIGGIPEQVEDGVTGLLCPPGDSGALAVALARR